MRSSGFALLATLAAISMASSSASAAYVTVYGGPTYDAASHTGYQSPGLPVAPGRTAGNGVAVGHAQKHVGGKELGPRAFRWGASGGPATELGGLGISTSGFQNTYAYAVNPAGTAVGSAFQYNGGTFLAQRAVRWDASSPVATVLSHLGTDGDGFTSSEALAVNDAGTAVGFARKYSFGSDLGPRAVRWDASGTAVTELGNLGTANNLYTSGIAWAVNSAGTAVGAADWYLNGTNLGSQPVRWDASGTAATQLGNIDNSSNNVAYAINAAGTAVGYGQKFYEGGFVGRRAVRWDASGTEATELDHIGTDNSHSTDSLAYAVNDAGTAVGFARKYDSSGNYLGERAIRWDASGTAATVLGDLNGGVGDIDGSGGDYTTAFAINNAGFAVGGALKFTDGINGYRATLWDLGGTAFDLNRLIDPGSGWTLTEARGISDTNWVTGYGRFDPDGSGPQAAYARAFLLDVSGAVPEPGAAVLFFCGMIPAALGRRRERR